MIRSILTGSLWVARGLLCVALVVMLLSPAREVRTLQAQSSEKAGVRQALQHCLDGHATGEVEGILHPSYQDEPKGE